MKIYSSVKYTVFARTTPICHLSYCFDTGAGAGTGSFNKVQPYLYIANPFHTFSLRERV